MTNEVEVHTVSVDADYLTSIEEDKAKKKFQEKYNVKGCYFADGENSSWSLTGKVKDLQKCIKKEWGVEDPYEVIFDEDEMWVLAED